MSVLYLEHFGLHKSPFQITPDIDFFFSGSRRGDLLAALIHVACNEEGIATIVAEVGSGKTLLARLMIDRLPREISTVYLANPCFSRDEIISAISRDLGLKALPATLEEKLACLHHELLRRHGEGQRVLLVVDEAHTMPMESLEEIRLLSNLETSRHKLVNIMLFGQPELDELLADRRLRQLRDRIIHRFELPPLSEEDGAAYIDHRLRTAGWTGGKLVDDEASRALLKASGGRARRVNLLADKALLAAFAEGKQEVSREHVRTAIRELPADPAPPPVRQPRKLIFASAAVALAAALCFLAYQVLARWDGSRTSSNSAPHNSVARAPSAPPPAPATAAPETVAAQPVSQKPQAPSTPTPSSEQTPPPATVAAPSAPPPGEAGPSGSSRAGNVAHDKLGAAFERTAQKLNNPNVAGFTLQLVSLLRGTGLTEYLQNVDSVIDSANLYAHNRTYGGRPYVAVYLGHYQTEQEAKNALNQLPAPLKADKPIVRTWAGIRQESKQ